MENRTILFACIMISIAAVIGCTTEVPKVDLPSDHEGDDPGECNDNADNNRDNLFDCEDPGCAGSPVCDGTYTSTDSESNPASTTDPVDDTGEENSENNGSNNDESPTTNEVESGNQDSTGSTNDPVDDNSNSTTQDTVDNTERETDTPTNTGDDVESSSSDESEGTAQDTGEPTTPESTDNNDTGSDDTGSDDTGSDDTGSDDTETTQDTGVNEDEMWVVAYHPWYQWWDVSPEQVPWNHLTHLCLGYLNPVETQGNGYTLGVSDIGYGGSTQEFWNETREYVNAGHSAQKKVTLMLAGAGQNVGTMCDVWNFATSEDNVRTFATNIAEVCQDVGIDGVDLDWEDNCSFGDAERHAGIVRLAVELRDVWPDAIISIPGGMQGEDAVPLAPAMDVVDSYMPMTYIPIAQWGGWIVPIPLTPLHTYQSNPYSVDYVMNEWDSAGVPASKMIMGVGGFGTVWVDDSGDGRAPVAPYVGSDTCPEGECAEGHSDNEVTQNWLDQTLITHPEFVEGWDEVGECSYWSAPSANQPISVTMWGYTIDAGVIFYESPRSIGAKRDYVIDNGMKGMGFWTLSQMGSCGLTSPNDDFENCTFTSFPNLEAI